MALRRCLGHDRPVCFHQLILQSHSYILKGSVVRKAPCIIMQVGIALVGMSSLLSGEGSAQVEVSPEKMLLGMGLIVASQVSLLFMPALSPKYLKDLRTGHFPVMA